MSVNSIGDYSFESRDKLENFNGTMLVFIQWEQHLVFCAPFAFPLPPDMLLGEVMKNIVIPAYAYHPDTEKATLEDFAKGQWLLDNKPLQADFDKSLAEHGVKHQSILRVTTPGLEGLVGQGSAA